MHANQKERDSIKRCTKKGVKNFRSVLKYLSPKFIEKENDNDIKKYALN